MTYRVDIVRAALKQLTRLPASVRVSCDRAILSLADEPRPHGCRKIAGSAADWRIRVGVYRVIYEVDDKSAVVRIMRVRHRRESYR